MNNLKGFCFKTN